ncbi:MAG TPA: RICIN domain-containing protein [Terriglobales bacterium]|nr:RICIN domain-containing protein [Terriglobales bacterium]
MPRHNVPQYRFSSFIRALAAMPCLLLLLVLGFATTPASASVPNRIPYSYTSIAAAPEGGFWIQRDEGGTVAIEGAPQYESVQGKGSIAAIPGKSNNGYWVVLTGGQIYARGGAPELCGGHLSNCSGFNTLNSKHITAAAASPNGQGLWAVDSARNVWTAGNTVSYGDVNKDNETPTGIAATPSGKGYYIVMSDGGVHARGDAVFYGSTGGNRPGGNDISGIALSLNASGEVNGYWLLGDDGAIYTFGDAPFLGNSGGYSEYATGLTARPGGHSYAWVHANGQQGLSESLPIAIITSEDWGSVWDIGIYVGPGTPIRLGALNGTILQQWRLWPTTSDGRVVQIVNVYNGLCADVTEKNGSPLLIQFPCKGKNDGWDNQRFTIISDNAGRHQFLPMSPSNTTVVGLGRISELGLWQYYDGKWDSPASWTLRSIK